MPTTNPTIKSTTFAASTWDGRLHVYNCELSKLGYTSIVEKFSLKMPAPVLGIAWNSQNNGLFLGCADRHLRELDLNWKGYTTIGQHFGPIRDVFYLPYENVIISTSYDKNINFWQQGNHQPVHNIPLQHKVFTAACSGSLLVAGLSDEKVLLLNIRDLQRKYVIADSPLGRGSQLQSIAFNS